MKEVESNMAARSLSLRTFIVIVASLLCQAGNGAEYSGYLTLTSDYVKRGVTQSDGDPAVQLGLDVGFSNGFYLGAWGSSVDIRNVVFGTRDIETNYYAGYVHDATDDWRFTASIVAYEYPGADGPVDYSYQEYVLGSNYKDRVWLEIAYTPNGNTMSQSAVNVDLYTEWPLSDVWSIGGGGGRYELSSSERGSYNYWQLGVTGSFQYADVDLRFHDASRWIPIISSPERVKGRASLTIRIPF